MSFIFGFLDVSSWSDKGAHLWQEYHRSVTVSHLIASNIRWRMKVKLDGAQLWLILYWWLTLVICLPGFIKLLFFPLQFTFFLFFWRVNILRLCRDSISSPDFQFSMSICMDSQSLSWASCHSLLLSFILMLKLSKRGPFQLVSVLFWHDSINIWAPRRSLYLPHSSPEINHFSKDLGPFSRKMMLRFGVLIGARVSLCLDFHSDTLGSLYLHFNMYIYFHIYLFILTFFLFLFLLPSLTIRNLPPKASSFGSHVRELENRHSVLIRSRKLNRKDNELFFGSVVGIRTNCCPPRIEREAITGSVKSQRTTVETRHEGTSAE